MLKKISMTIELTCPCCGTEVKHEHDFKLNCSLNRFKNNHITSIGHTKPLYEGSLNFNCPECKTWHTADVEAIEVHVLHGIKVDAFIATQEDVITKNIKEVEDGEKSSCCGRCDGVNDICVADTLCTIHEVEGCETCFEIPKN